MDWNDVPVFGRPPSDGRVALRPSAYAILCGPRGRLAVVRAPQGLFLPGGGLAPGETAEDAVVREVREECGLVVEIGEWRVHAVDYVDARAERVHFAKQSTFVEAYITGPPVAPRETDHALEWLVPARAIAELSHPSQRWAVAQWQARAAANDRPDLFPGLPPRG